MAFLMWKSYFRNNDGVSKTRVKLNRRFFVNLNSQAVIRNDFFGSTSKDSSEIPATEVTTKILRPYQKECIERSLEEYRNGVRRMAVSLPVGSGKTVIFSSLIQQLPAPTPRAHKTLVLAHREELLVQAQLQIQQAAPHLTVSIERSGQYSNITTDDVIIASVPTLGRSSGARNRLARFDPADFKAIIIDEAHHSAADSYMRIMEHFISINEDWPEKELSTADRVHSRRGEHIMVWGCSATLSRQDDRSLGSIFEKVVYHMSMGKAIEEGWLVKPEQRHVYTETYLDSVRRKRSRGGEDFDQTTLSLAINTPHRNKLVARTWYNVAWKEQGCQSTIVFALNIQHVNNLVAAFNAIQDGGIERILGDSDDDEDEKGDEAAKDDEEDDGIFEDEIRRIRAIAEQNARKGMKKHRDRDESAYRPSAKTRFFHGRKHLGDESAYGERNGNAKPRFYRGRGTKSVGPALTAIQNDGIEYDRKESAKTPFFLGHKHEEASSPPRGKFIVASVTSQTDWAERVRILEQYTAGEIHVLVNCSVFIEGTDLPRTDCIVMTRPTCNANLYTQMVGRGLRLHGSKQSCLVLDFIDRIRGTNRSLITFPCLLQPMPSAGGEIGGGSDRLVVQDITNDTLQVHCINASENGPGFGLAWIKISDLVYAISSPVLNTILLKISPDDPSLGHLEEVVKSSSNTVGGQWHSKPLFLDDRVEEKWNWDIEEQLREIEMVFNRQKDHNDNQSPAVERKCEDEKIHDLIPKLQVFLKEKKTLDIVQAGALWRSGCRPTLKQINMLKVVMKDLSGPAHQLEKSLQNYSVGQASDMISKYHIFKKLFGIQPTAAALLDGVVITTRPPAHKPLPQ